MLFIFVGYISLHIYNLHGVEIYTCTAKNSEFLISVLIVTIVLSKGYLGEDYCYGTGVWCGIKSTLPPETITTWMYISDIAWQLACYLSTCFLYIFLIFVVSRFL